MDRRTAGIVLLIAGVLVFLWATSQISNLPPAFLMPYEIVKRNEQTAAMYRLLQIGSALAAIGGGVLIFARRRSP